MKGTLLFVVLLGGCLGMQDVVNICDTEPDRCPPCSADEQCVFSSNPCHETAYCHHVDVEVSVNMIGCNRSYDRPPDEDCRCIAQQCRAQ